MSKPDNLPPPLQGKSKQIPSGTTLPVLQIPAGIPPPIVPNSPKTPTTPNATKKLIPPPIASAPAIPPPLNSPKISSKPAPIALPPAAIPQPISSPNTKSPVPEIPPSIIPPLGRSENPPTSPAAGSKPNSPLTATSLKSPHSSDGLSKAATNGVAPSIPKSAALPPSLNKPAAIPPPLNNAPFTPMADGNAKPETGAIPPPLQKPSAVKPPAPLIPPPISNPAIPPPISNAGIPPPLNTPIPPPSPHSPPLVVENASLLQKPVFCAIPAPLQRSAPANLKATAIPINNAALPPPVTNAGIPPSINNPAIPPPLNSPAGSHSVKRPVTLPSHAPGSATPAAMSSPNLSRPKKPKPTAVASVPGAIPPPASAQQISPNPPSPTPAPKIQHVIEEIPDTPAPQSNVSDISSPGNSAEVENAVPPLEEEKSDETQPTEMIITKPNPNFARIRAARRSSAPAVSHPALNALKSNPESLAVTSSSTFPKLPTPSIAPTGLFVPAYDLDAQSIAFLAETNPPEFHNLCNTAAIAIQTCARRALARNLYRKMWDQHEWKRVAESKASSERLASPLKDRVGVSKAGRRPPSRGHFQRVKSVAPQENVQKTTVPEDDGKPKVKIGMGGTPMMSFDPSLVQLRKTPVMSRGDAAQDDTTLHIEEGSASPIAVRKRSQTAGSGARVMSLPGPIKPLRKEDLQKPAHSPLFEPEKSGASFPPPLSIPTPTKSNEQQFPPPSASPPPLESPSNPKTEVPEHIQKKKVLSRFFTKRASRDDLVQRKILKEDQYKELQGQTVALEPQQATSAAISPPSDDTKKPKEKEKKKKRGLFGKKK